MVEGVALRIPSDIFEGGDLFGFQNGITGAENRFLLLPAL
jgi:hypothetical protein